MQMCKYENKKRNLGLFCAKASLLVISSSSLHLKASPFSMSTSSTFYFPFSSTLLQLLNQSVPEVFEKDKVTSEFTF